MDSNGLTLPSLVRSPKVSLRHAPLLLLLHGQDSNEKDIYGISESLDDRFLVVCPRGLFHRYGQRYNWYQAELVAGNWLSNSIQAEYSRQALIKLLDESIQKYRTEPTLTFVMGFCQGAVMALNLMISEPNRFAGIVAISGQLLPEMRTTPTNIHILHGLSVFASHGMSDEIYPTGCGRIIRDTLTGWGINLSYREYDSGHFITREIVGDVRSWLSGRLDEKGIVATPTNWDYRLRLGHVQIKVRSLERAIAFYTRYLGLHLVERTGKTYAFLASSDAHHELALQNVGPEAPIPPPHAAGLGNLAFHVPDPHTFAKVFKALLEAAIPVSLVDHQIGWGIIFTDPDGNGIEIYCDMRDQPGRSRLWQGRDLPLEPEKVLAILEQK